jgi:hypothetical protein
MGGADHRTPLSRPDAPDALAPLVRAGLDTLGLGLAIFDRDLRLVASNRACAAILPRSPGPGPS